MWQLFLLNVFTKANLKAKRCQIKNIFSVQDMVATTVSKQVLDCVTPSGTVYFDCNFLNVIH